MIFENSYVELAPVIEAALESSRLLMHSRRHTLTTALPAEPLYLCADPIRIAQVIANLLDNAAKFTESGGQIRLSVERMPAAEQASESVQITVSDDGIGTTLELSARIFDLFTQGDFAKERNSADWAWA